MITVSQLGFQFPRSDFRLAVPALAIKRGERIAIVGPSGSGNLKCVHWVPDQMPSDEKHTSTRLRANPIPLESLNRRSRSF